MAGRFFAQFLVLVAPTFALSAPLLLDKAIDLSDFQGKPFFEAMTAPGGIKEALDADEQASFTVADKATLHRAAKADFEPSVYQKLTRLFKNGEKGFDALVDGLQGESLTPATVAGAIAGQLKQQGSLVDVKKIGLSAVMIAPFLSLASGAGTEVTLNRENYYYNYGYLPGSDDKTELARDLKSGRSFGAGPGHRALDASDVFYLTELGNYLEKTSDPLPFYRVLLGVLTQNDTSGFDALNSEGQTVATDFFAIYTAELDRHIMAHLQLHPWENDLAEVTLLSAYGTRVGMIHKNGRLVRGKPKDYFGVGPGGSGIGETRRDRRALQVKLTQSLRKLHPEVVTQLEKLIGAKRGSADVFRGFMEYLNNTATQSKVKRDATKLSDSVEAIVEQLSGDADELTKEIK
jgi:hypothetical protein